MSARYAVFFAPDNSSNLASYGACTLRRLPDAQAYEIDSNSFQDQSLAEQLTATPTHYGFHATLKAPFYLASGTSEQQLFEAVEEFCKSQKPIVLDGLKPQWLGSFMALSFAGQPQEIIDLASQCVTSFERFRAPLMAEDLSKRKPDSLSEVQKTYLYKYGYPFVMSEFNFHMTLTSRFECNEYPDYVEWLQNLYDEMVPDTPYLDRLVVFSQVDRKTPFKQLAQFPFG